MNIPRQLLERACKIVQEKRKQSLPFYERGVKIDHNLIEAAVSILNDCPSKTLPQNCRNAIRQRTPDGLDRRIKEKLNTDLRTANIITDILAEAGVVENVRINNPETGKQVKGTRLLDSWIWDSTIENNNVSKTYEVDYTRLDEIKKSDLNKQTTGNNLSRENYLNNITAREFSEWLELSLDKPGTFKHGYYLKKARSHWNCSCLYEAYEKYWWPFNMFCPVGDRHIGGSGLSDSFNYLTQLAGIFRSSVRDNDVELTQKGALAMLAWGGVLNKNRERILNMGNGICTFFKEVQEKLSMSEVRLNNHNDIFYLELSQSSNLL